MVERGCATVRSVARYATEVQEMAEHEMAKRGWASLRLVIQYASASLLSALQLEDGKLSPERRLTRERHRDEMAERGWGVRYASECPLSGLQQVDEVLSLEDLLGRERDRDEMAEHDWAVQYALEYPLNALQREDEVLSLVCFLDRAADRAETAERGWAAQYALGRPSSALQREDEVSSPVCLLDREEDRGEMAEGDWATIHLVALYADRPPTHVRLAYAVREVEAANATKDALVYLKVHVMGESKLIDSWSIEESDTQMVMEHTMAQWSYSCSPTITRIDLELEDSLVQW